MNKRRESIKLLIKERKLAGCIDCGLSDPCQMTFDHLGDKCFDIADAPRKSLGAVLRELDKCQVVCRTCHDIRELKRGIGGLTPLILAKISGMV